MTAAAEPVYVVLSRLEGVRKQTGYWMARCPAHEDSTASLSVSVGNEQPVILKCHAGCAPADVLAALTPPLSWDDLCKPRAASNGTGPVVIAEYKYTDEAGELLFVKERRQPKDFRIRRPDGRGGWVWNLGETRRVLYRLPQVRDAIAAGLVVYVVEGEKDVHAVEAAGAVATCNYDGAAKPGQRTKVRPEYADMLAGAQVVIVADDDEPGHEHARQWARILGGRAASVRLVLPTTGKDAHDHLTAGKTPEDFRPFASSTDTPADRDDEPDEVILAAVPEYPVRKLRGPLRQFIEWAVKDGLLAPAVGAAGLSALATVCGYAELEFRTTVVIRPALWVVPIGGPGTGKSPARTQAFRPIKRLYAEERREWRQECQAVRERNQQLRQETPKGTIYIEEEMPPRPEPLTLGDVNMPTVARWLEVNGGAGSLSYDEVKALIAGLHSEDRAKLMEAWTAREELHLQRVGQGGSVNAIDVYVERPVLGIFGPLTPKDLRLLGQEGDGFRSRWLPHLVKGKARMLDGGPPPESWAATLEKLYRNRELRTWHLSTDAGELFTVAAARWEKQQEEPYPPGVIEAMRKAETQCLRICIPLAESTYTEGQRVVSKGVMDAAIALTDYALDCWKALPGGSALALGFNDDRLISATDELLAWLEDRPCGNEGLPQGSPPRPRATSREIMRACVGGARDAESVWAMIGKYARQFPGCLVTVENTSGKGGGRPRKFVYYPRREGVSTPRIDVSADIDVDSRTHAQNHETAGSEAAQSQIIGVSTADIDPADTDPADIDPGTEATISLGRCSWCGTPCSRYGQNGKPLCGECYGSQAELEPRPAPALMPKHRNLPRR